MAAYGGGKPKFNEFQTPIGMICHLFHDKPQLKTKDQHGKVPDIDPETGIQRAEFKITLAWAKQRVNELNEMIALAQQTQAEAWPESVKPGAFFQLEPFFRDGDNPAHNTKNRDYLRGRYYLNLKSKAEARLMYPGQPAGPNNPVQYSGAPGLLGPYGPEDILMPQDIWAGCTGRASGIMFGTEYAGRNFISVRLNNIQKYDEGDGTRIGGVAKPTAAEQFGALKQGQPGGQANPFGGGMQQGANPFGTTSSTPQGGFGAPAQNPFGVQGASPSNNPFGQNPFGNKIL